MDLYLGGKISLACVACLCLGGKVSPGFIADSSGQLGVLCKYRFSASSTIQWLTS